MGTTKTELFNTEQNEIAALLKASRIRQGLPSWNTWSGLIPVFVETSWMNYTWRNQPSPNIWRNWKMPGWSKGASRELPFAIVWKNRLCSACSNILQESRSEKNRKRWVWERERSEKRIGKEWVWERERSEKRIGLNVEPNINLYYCNNKLSQVSFFNYEKFMFA